MFSLGEIASEVHLRIDQGDEADVPALKKNGVLEILKGAFDVMSQAVAAGEEVSIPKFGKLEPVIRAERKGRNPQTGEAITVPEKMAVKFKPSTTLRNMVADGDISALKKSKKKAPAKGKKTSAKKKKKK